LFFGAGDVSAERQLGLKDQPFWMPHRRSERCFAVCSGEIGGFWGVGDVQQQIAGEFILS
jgi:hypothetical protein